MHPDIGKELRVARREIATTLEGIQLAREIAKGHGLEPAEIGRLDDVASGLRVVLADIDRQVGK